MRFEKLIKIIQSNNQSQEEITKLCKEFFISNHQEEYDLIPLEKCSNCYDHLNDETKFENCPVCNGKGYVKEEYTPLLDDELNTKINTIMLCPKENPTLEEVKIAKYKQLGEWHKNIFKSGKVVTQSGIVIDARRYEEKNDLQNIQGLIRRYKRGHTLPAFRDANNKDHDLSIEQLEQFTIEIEDYHAEMFNKKHAWALEITNATTVEEIVNIEIV